MKSRPRLARLGRQSPSSSPSISALSPTSAISDLSNSERSFSSNTTSLSINSLSKGGHLYSDSSTFIQYNPRYSSLWLQKCALPERLEASTLNATTQSGLNPDCYPYPNMADSVDRVFVHALNTVKRIPRTGSARPPESDRLKLYGLYKQATEGDVQGLLPRPSPSPPPYSSKPPPPQSSLASTHQSREHTAEREKYDAWASHHGLTKTEAKRRYIDCLIATMHRYATTTSEARELVGELEFVWDQIKGGSSPESGGSAERVVRRRRRGEDEGEEEEEGGGAGNLRMAEGGHGLKVLRPMSDEGADEAEDEDESEEGFQDAREKNVYATQTGGIVTAMPSSAIRSSVDPDVGTRKWRRRMQVALVKLSVEIAALREHIESRSLALEKSGGGRGRIPRWLRWWVSFLVKHAVLDGLLVFLMLAWARWRGDRRLEEGLWGVWCWIRDQFGRVRAPILLKNGIKLF